MLKNDEKNSDFENSQKTDILPEKPTTEEKPTIEETVIVLSDAENAALVAFKIDHEVIAPVVEKNAIVEAEPPKEILVDKVAVKVSNIIKPSKPVIEDKARTRISLTANFAGNEIEPLQKVIKWRIENKLTTTSDHFVRQCIDFAMCHGTILQDYLKNIPAENIGLFAIPTEIKLLPLEKKGFFNK